MGIQLKIKFDGDVPGLAEHRLDLVAFEKAITCLTTGLRRTASGLLKEAVESTAGRLAKGAELQIFLDALTEGSAQLTVSVDAPILRRGENASFFADLPLRASKQFVEAIDAESRGEMRSVLARRFLAALPSGLNSQQYQLYNDGKVIFDVTHGAVVLPQEPAELPVVVKSEARILGLTFEPHAEVRLDIRGTKLTCSASDALIDTAIRLHGTDVSVMVVADGSKGRLLWLGQADDFPAPLTKEQRAEHVLSRWEKTLERLSR